jgi:hypothetical protein
MLVWEWSQAPRVIDEWARWAADAPDEATTVLRLFRAPDVSWLPAAVRGRNAVVIDGAIVGDPRAAADMIAPLRALRPEIDTFRVTPAASLARLHLEPEEPLAAYASSTLLAGLPPNAVEALVGAAGPDSGSELLFAEVRQLGGALSRPSPRGGALDRIDGAFLVLTLGAGESPGGWATQRADAERVLDAVQPWGTGALYLAMIDDHVDERRAVPTAQWERLNRVRLAADPDGRFVVPHFSSGKPGAASVK